MNKWTFALYGSDTDILHGSQPKEFPDELELIQSDLVSFSEEGLGAFPFYEDQGETVEYLNGFTQRRKKFRMKFSLKFYPRNFPTADTYYDHEGDITTTTVESFYYNSTLSKKYNWVKFPADYYLKPAGLVGFANITNVMRVNIVGFNITQENGQKSITLEMERIYAG